MDTGEPNSYDPETVTRIFELKLRRARSTVSEPIFRGEVFRERYAINVFLHVFVERVRETVKTKPAFCPLVAGDFFRLFFSVNRVLTIYIYIYM